MRARLFREARGESASSRLAVRLDLHEPSDHPLPYVTITVYRCYAIVAITPRYALYITSW